jgi:hypothetical protein
MGMGLWPSEPLAEDSAPKCQNYETFLLNYEQKVIVFKFKALMKVKNY